MRMEENDFWKAVNPYLEQDGAITIENLQLALGLSEEKAIEEATRFCEEHKLFRVVTRHSWGYVRIDPEEDLLPPIEKCGGVIKRKTKSSEQE